MIAALSHITQCFQLLLREPHGPQPGSLNAPTQASPLVQLFQTFPMSSTRHLEPSSNYYLSRRRAHNDGVCKT